MIKGTDNIHVGIEKLAGAARVVRLKGAVSKLESKIKLLPENAPQRQALETKLWNLEDALSSATDKYSRRMQKAPGQKLQSLFKNTPEGISPAKHYGIKGTISAMGTGVGAAGKQIGYNIKSGISPFTNLRLSQSGAESVATKVMSRNKKPS